MKEYNIPTEINAIGFPVKSFPDGINEAFESLVNKIPDGFSRPYYGIVDSIDGKMVYIAAAKEKSEGEGEKLGLEHYKIEKGKYLSEEVQDWRNKTGSIKNMFEKMHQDERADKTKPSVEVYLNESEMLCLVKVRETKNQEPRSPDPNMIQYPLSAPLHMPT